MMKYIVIISFLIFQNGLAGNLACDFFQKNYGKGVRYSSVPQECLNEIKNNSLIALSEEYDVFVKPNVIVVNNKLTNKDHVITGSNSKYSTPAIVKIASDILIYDSGLNEILTFPINKGGNLARKRSFSVGDDNKVLDFVPLEKLKIIVVLYERGEVKLFNYFANKHGGNHILAGKKSLFDMLVKGKFKSLKVEAGKSLSITTDSMSYVLDLNDLQKIRLID